MSETFTAREIDYTLGLDGDYVYGLTLTESTLIDRAINAGFVTTAPGVAKVDGSTPIAVKVDRTLLLPFRKAAKTAVTVEELQQIINGFFDSMDLETLGFKDCHLLNRAENLDLVSFTEWPYLVLHKNALEAYYQKLVAEAKTTKKQTTIAMAAHVNAVNKQYAKAAEQYAAATDHTPVDVPKK